MQKYKNTIILLGILIVLIAITAICKTCGKRTRTKKSTTAAFKKYKIAKAKEIIIVSSSNQAHLVLAPTGWIVKKDSFPADTAEVSKILGHIDSLTTQTLVSSNPQKQAKFEVDTTKAVRVKVVAQDTVVDLMLGKAGPDYNSTYFRAFKSDKVYLYKKGIKWQFDKADDRWRDTYVLRLSKDEVSTINLKYPDAELELAKGADGTWRVSKPQDYGAKQNDVNTMINALTSMHSSDMQRMTGMPEVYGFDKHTCTATLIMNQGSQYQLQVGKFDDEKKQYSVKRTDTDFVYTIAEYQGSNFMKRFEEIKEEPKPEDSTKAEAPFEKK
jgi:hypothetical protein